jgi:hypothetical protein
MSNQVEKNKEYTLSYDSGVKGFPSFYSYNPDWMIGMNNYFYTFKGGNVFRHNTNETRNQYYGVNYPAKVESVFNEQPLENKLFKTMNLEGDDSWTTTLKSDIQDTGFINADYYEKKEQAYFAFIRNTGQTFASPANENQYALRSLNGIATSQNIQVDFPLNGQTQVSFATTILIGSIISIGDMLYFGTTPQLLGQVVSVNVDIPNGINNIIVDYNIGGAATPTTSTEFILYIKNSVAESHGILGHYAVFSLINNNTSKVELFAVESEVMKSFP